MITVKVVAPFSLNNASPDGELILPQRATIHTLLRKARAPLFAYALPVSVNSHVVPKRTRLADGDLVVFIVPISGG